MAPLPFELVVLEVALGDVCAELGRRARELEQQAHPAVEALTKDVRACWTPRNPCLLPEVVMVGQPLDWQTTGRGCAALYIAARQMLLIPTPPQMSLLITSAGTAYHLLYTWTLCHARQKPDTQCSCVCR